MSRVRQVPGANPAGEVIPPRHHLWPGAWARACTGWAGRVGRLPAWLWQHRADNLTALLAAAAALLLLLRGHRLPLGPRILLGTAATVAALVVLARALAALIGPVLALDLIRGVRQDRTFFLRGLYLAALLVALTLLFTVHFPFQDLLQDPFSTAHLRQDQLRAAAESFFLALLAVQLGAVFLLTPAFTATAITEEKERGTLEFLLTSKLLDREIILGKFLSRLMGLALVLLAGLPVLGLLQLLGGVDPNLVLAGFAVTLLSMLGLGSLGLYNSVRLAHSRSALLTTYTQATGYLLFSGLCCFGVFHGTELEPISWLAAGNPVTAYLRAAATATTAAGTTGSSLLPIVRDYALFHGTACALLLVLAVRHLRPRGVPGWTPSPPAAPAPRRPAAPTPEPVPAPAALGRPLDWPADYPWHGVWPDPLPPPRPRPRARPVLWKEMYLGQDLTLPLLVRSALVSLLALVTTLAIITFMGGLVISLGFGHMPQFSNTWVRVLATPVACLMALGIALRAAGTWSGERDRHTLDALLTTPLDNQTLLWEKGLGSILSVRSWAWGLGGILVAGLLTLGVHPLSLVLLLSAYAGYAAFAAGVGTWFSLRSGSSLRATVATLLTLGLVASGGPLFVAVLYPLAILLDRFWDIPADWAWEFAFLRWPFPLALDSLTFPAGSWYTLDPEMREHMGRVGLTWIGVCVHIALAAALWYGLVRRSGGVLQRMPYGPPPQDPGRSEARP